MMVFLVSGLWHGAQISFIVWGGLNGLYQVIGEILKPIRDKVVKSLNLNRDSLGHKLLQIVGTFLLIDFSWIFFRANSFSDAIQIIKGMFTVKNPWVLFDGSIYNCGLDSKNFLLMLICIGILLFADLCKTRNIIIWKVIIEQHYWVRCLLTVVVVLFILTFGKYGPAYNAENFIFFQS